MTEKARYIFRFSFKHKAEIKMWRVDPKTNKEEELTDLRRGAYGSFVWGLEENSKSWVSCKIAENKLVFWVKEHNTETKRDRHFQVIQARNKDLETQDLEKSSPYEAKFFAEEHEMEKDKEGKNWFKKNR